MQTDIRVSSGQQEVQSTDQKGRFSFERIVPGDYGLIGWEDVAAGAWFNAEFLKDFENRMTRITIGPDSSNNRNITIISSDWRLSIRRRENVALPQFSNATRSAKALPQTAQLSHER